MAKAVEIEFLMRDRMTPGMRKAYNEIVGLDKEIDKLANTTDRVTSNMGKSFGNLEKIIGGALSVAGAKTFIEKMFDIRSSFQDTEAAMRVFLGSTEKARQFMKELTDYAWYNMFEFSDLTSESSKLLAFGNNVETVIPILDKLSNIATGTKKPLSELVDLFTKAQSIGKLDSEDIKSWGQRGVDIMRILKEMGIEVDRSSVKFEHLEMVLERITASGGQFYNLMEEQMDNLSASYGQLLDNIALMFNELGEEYQDAMKSGIDMAAWMVDNYEKIGKGILALIATYGTYRTALALTIVAEKGWTLSQMANYKALLLVEKAQKLLNKTMLSNPYVLVATTVIALGTAIWALSDATNAQAEAEKRLKELHEEFTKAIVAEQAEIDILFGRLKAAKEGTEAYQKAKDAILGKYGKYLEGLSEEISSLRDVEAAYKAISEAALQATRDRMIEVGTRQAADAYGESFSNYAKKIRNAFLKEFGNLKGEELFQDIRNSLEKGEPWSKELEIAISTFDRQRDTYQMGQRISSYVVNPIKDAINSIQYSKNVLDKEITEIQSLFGDLSKAPEESGSKEPVLSDINKELETAKQKVGELKEKLKDLRLGKIQSSDYAKDIQDTADELEKAEKRLATLTGKDKKTVKTEQAFLSKEKKQAQETAELRRKVANDEIREALEKQSREMENEQALLNIQEDGFEKRQKQAELNHRKNLQAIEKRTQELIEKQQEAEKNAWKLEGEKRTFVPNTLTTDDLYKNNPEAKKEIDESRSTVNKVYKAETDALYKELLDKYKDYAHRRKEVEEQFQKDIKALNGLPDENERKKDAIKEAEKRRKEAIKSINEEEASEIKKTSDLFVRLFADASTQTVKEIRRVIDEVQVMYDYLANTKDEDIAGNFNFSAEQLRNFKGDAEQLKAILDGLIAKKKELAGKSEFEAFSQSINEALKKINKGGTANIGEGIADIGSAISGIMPSVEKFGQDIGSIFGEDTAADIKVITDLLGATVEVGTGVGKIMSGDVIGGIQDVVSGLAKVFSMVSEAEKRHQKALEEIASRRLDLQRQYNLLLLEQNLLLREASTVFGEKEITKAANALKNYEETLRQIQEEMQGEAPNRFQKIFNSGLYEKQLQAYSDGIKGLQDTQIVTGHKKTGFLGLGSGKDTYSSILDVYDDVIDAEGRLNTERIRTILDTQKMNDETRAYLENLLALEEQAEAAAEALRSYLQETFGVLGEDIISSITSAIIDQGINAWEEFGKSGAKVIEALGEQLAYELFFADKFAGLQADLEAIYSNTSDPEEIARRQLALIGNFYSTIDDEMAAAQSFLEGWKKNAGEQGFDLWSDESSSQSGKAGAFTTMTQDQAGKLEGLFTSVQNHVASMDDKMSDLSAAMYESIDVLLRIEENTSYCRELETIKEDIKAIIRDGLRVR